MMRTLAVAVAFVFTFTLLPSLSSVDAQLPPAGAIAGAVTGPEGPLRGAVIQVIDSTGALAGTAVTNGAGAFRIEKLPPGSYTVHVRDAAGQVIATSRASLTPEAMVATLRIDASAGALARTAAQVPAGVPGRGPSAKVVLASVGAAAASLGTLLVVSSKEDLSGSR